MTAVRRAFFVACVLLLGAAMVSLLVDERLPAGPVLLLLGGLCSVGVFLAGAAERGAERREERRVRAAGIRADGVILSLADTGRTSEDSRLWEVAVRITLPGSPPYVATVVQTCGMYERPGRRTPVTVSATDPYRIWIEYDPSYR